MILFWKLECDTKYTLTKTQFIEGLANLGMETSSKIKSRISTLKSEISSPKDFKKFYMWCFTYMKDPTQKRIHIDFALPTWKLIMKGKYKYLDEWIKFWENGKDKTIPKDVWGQFLEFTNDVGFSNWKDFDSGAYPLSIEEFVDFMKSK
jgi:DCN1-like protein 1/2